MKKIILSLAVVAFIAVGTISVTAQDQQKKVVKKEATTKEAKKADTKECATAKKGCCDTAKKADKKKTAKKKDK